MARGPVWPRPAFTTTPDGTPTYSRGPRWPAWALLAVPFVFIMIPLYGAIRSRVRWAACFTTVALFEAILIVVEHQSIMRGHWVYNEHGLLGPRIWNVPIEEPLIYYFLPPILAIMIYEFTTGLLDGSLHWGRLTDLPRRWRPRRVPASGGVRSSRGAG